MLSEAILSLLPKAQFSIWGDEIIWHDSRPMPDEELIRATAAELEANKPSKEEIEAKRFAALAKLEALGLSEDDLKALGL